MFLNTAVWIKVMLAILIAFVVSFALTPVVKILAQKVGAMDVPGEARRVHDHPIPRMGGLAIFLGFIVSMLLFVDITQEVRGILLGAIIIVIGRRSSVPSPSMRSGTPARAAIGVNSRVERPDSPTWSVRPRGARPPRIFSV